MSDTQANETREQRISNGKAPLYTHRMSGSAVFVKIWENTSKDGRTYYTTSIGRTYTAPNTEQTRDTANLSQAQMNQLPPLITQANQTLHMLRDQERTNSLQAQRDQVMINAADHSAQQTQQASPEVGRTPSHVPEQ